MTLSTVQDDFIGIQLPQLSVIVPTFNERENVEPMINALSEALAGIPFEVVFVDDNSPDGTAALVKQFARARSGVRCLHRIGRRGLSSAVVEGVLSSSAPFVAVVDGDMQHDETKLPAMLALLQNDSADVVVGSRYVEGGGLGDWTASRVWMSKFAAGLSRTILKGQALQDPMSGFFMTRRDSFDRVVPHLSIEGFKILLDFIASTETRLRIAEVPYHFRLRVHGESKLDSLVLWEYAVLLLDKLVGRFVPPRFVLFVAVGATGVAVHFSVLASLISFAKQDFLYAQGVATLVAMTWNFILNDTLTYRDKRLKGIRWFKGLLSFYLVCGLGALANVGIASALFEKSYSWWVAASAGIVVGTVFNYAMTSMFTWKGRK
jgi:dolichol-phosphate mannosyltransferase